MLPKLPTISRLYAFCFLFFSFGLSSQPTFEFQHFNTQDGLSQSSIVCILQDSQGFMWFGTYDGLNRYDGFGFKVYKAVIGDSTHLQNNNIYALHEDHHGVLWVGTMGGGISRYDRERDNFQTFLNNPNDSTSISNNNVRHFTEDREGYLWVATWGGGVNRFNPETGKCRRFVHDSENSNSLQDNIVNKVVIDSWGTVWMATTKGLDRYLPKEKIFQ